VGLPASQPLGDQGNVTPRTPTAPRPSSSGAVRGGARVPSADGAHPHHSGHREPTPLHQQVSNLVRLLRHRIGENVRWPSSPPSLPYHVAFETRGSRRPSRLAFGSNTRAPRAPRSRGVRFNTVTSTYSYGGHPDVKSRSKVDPGVKSRSTPGSKQGRPRGQSKVDPEVKARSTPRSKVAGRPRGRRSTDLRASYLTADLSTRTRAWLLRPRPLASAYPVGGVVSLPSQASFILTCDGLCW
jgi:hypothetical protein